jgi:Superinfection immunity protein
MIWSVWINLFALTVLAVGIVFLISGYVPVCCSWPHTKSRTRPRLRVERNLNNGPTPDTDHLSRNSIYFLPEIVADRRKAKHEISIFWVNFFLGRNQWSICLALRCQTKPRSRPYTPFIICLIARQQSLAARKRSFFFFSFSILFLLLPLCQRLLRVKHGRYDPATILTSSRRLSKFLEKKSKNTIPGFWRAISKSTKN